MNFLPPFLLTETFRKYMDHYGRSFFRIFILLLSIFTWSGSFAQNLQSNNPVIQEFLRRKQLASPAAERSYSFVLRPYETSLTLKQGDSLSTDSFLGVNEIKNKQKIRFEFLPINQKVTFNTKRPYGWGDGLMIPNVGLQYYLSTGIYSKLWIFHIQLQPEYIVASNRQYQGFNSNFSEQIIKSKFRDYNTGDYPERFGEGRYSRFWWGQSKLTVQAGAFELGVATQNIWWGPGQWNSLTFSYNASGFPHLTINTRRPAKTFLGNFEGQILSGRLENSMFSPTQDSELNEQYFRGFTGDWRYLNAILISYNPKWIPSLYLGLNRTFQQYNLNRGNKFRDYFPIFDAFQKEKIFENGNSAEFDNEGRDQQLVFFFRLLVPAAKMEIYGEYGRRDHNFNWREAILNPEHARAFLFGFNKLIQTSHSNHWFQIRGELTQQQESVNRYIRYDGITGGLSWGTHTRARGFSELGQPLGVGIGTGSNVQTLELSLVEGINKKGLLIERLANNQDFYYRAFGQNTHIKPWVDLSLGLLWDQQWNNLIFSGKAQFIKSYNYQWIQQTSGPADLHKGHNPFAFYGTLNLIYRIGGN